MAVAAGNGSMGSRINKGLLVFLLMVVVVVVVVVGVICHGCHGWDRDC